MSTKNVEQGRGRYFWVFARRELMNMLSRQILVTNYREPKKCSCSGTLLTLNVMEKSLHSREYAMPIIFICILMGVTCSIGSLFLFNVIKDNGLKLYGTRAS